MDSEDIDNLLQNPDGQYDKMKEVFMKKCDEVSWDNIVNELQHYLKKTMQFENSYPDLTDKILQDTSDIIRYFMWAMPTDLREGLDEVDRGDPAYDADYMRNIICLYVNADAKAHSAKQKIWTSRKFVYRGIANDDD